MSIPQTDQDFMSHRTTPTTSSNSGAENNLMSSSRISSNTTNSQTSRIMPNWSDIFPPPPLEQPPPIPPPNSNSSSRNNIFNNLRIQQVKMKAGHLETWNLPLLIVIVVFRQETWVLQHPAGNSNSQTWSTMEFSRGWRVKVGKVSISMKTLRSIIPPGHLSPTVHFWAPEGWTPPRINLLVTDQKLDFRPTNLWKKSSMFQNSSVAKEFMVNRCQVTSPMTMPQMRMTSMILVRNLSWRILLPIWAWSPSLIMIGGLITPEAAASLLSRILPGRITRAPRRQATKSPTNPPSSG